DLDGDELDELIIHSGESVLAFNPEKQETIWEYKLESQTAFHSFARTEGGFELRLHLYRGFDSDSQRLVAINEKGPATWTHVGPRKWRSQSGRDIPRF
ncbi:MAG: hypothetical protein AAF497_11650, partial [Planctomycetota bacterium]